MKKMKRVVAIALAAVMTMGSTLTVFAAETGSDSSTGTGKNEGHVDRKVINVVLPTLPEEGSPFDYVIDPERLIQETKGAAYEGFTFPDKDSDKGIYFRTGEKEFSNTSQTLQVINKSSCDMLITVSAQAVATSADTDVKLATDTTADNLKAESPLFLGLNVGASTNAAQAIATTGETKVPKTISGTDGNFETQYTGSGYEYVVRADADEWKALNFSLTGEVFEGAVTATTTAPKVTVTWAFEEATGAADTADEAPYTETADPGILSIDDYVMSDPKDLVVKFSLGKGPNKVDADGAKLLQSETRGAVGTAMYTVDTASGTMTIKGDAGFLTKHTAPIELPIYIVLTKGSSEVKELATTLKIKADYDSAKIISISEFNKENPKDIVVKFSLGEGTNTVDADGAKLLQGTSKGAVGTTMYTVDIASGTMTIVSTAGFLNNYSSGTDVPIYVTLTKGDTEVKELAGTLIIK